MSISPIPITKFELDLNHQVQRTHFVKYQGVLRKGVAARINYTEDPTGFSKEYEPAPAKRSSYSSKRSISPVPDPKSIRQAQEVSYPSSEDISEHRAKPLGELLHNTITSELNAPLRRPVYSKPESRQGKRPKKLGSVSRHETDLFGTYEYEPEIEARFKNAHSFTRESVYHKKSPPETLLSKEGFQSFVKSYIHPDKERNFEIKPGRRPTSVRQKRVQENSVEEKNSVPKLVLPTSKKPSLDKTQEEGLQLKTNKVRDISLTIDEIIDVLNTIVTNPIQKPTYFDKDLKISVQSQNMITISKLKPATLINSKFQTHMNKLK